jgi:carbonic anhydrase/acetyltransferase-like protein (isoleucine patch superfamily)
MPERRHYGFEGHEPEVEGSARVSHESTLVGDVRVGPDASVWPGAVLRGDVDPVEVGPESHVGDNATVHASMLGRRVMVGHSCVINDSTVGDGSLVGFNSTVDQSTVGRDCVVAAGAVVQQGTTVPEGSFAHGVPANVVPLSETTIDVDRVFEDYHSGEYADLAERHGELFE